MIYGQAQSGPYKESGKNLRVISPGDNYVQFDGTETPAEDLKSVAIVRGPSNTMSQAYSTWHADGMPADMEIEVQSANTDEDEDYHTIGVMTSELASPAGAPYFTDLGSPLFYRLRVSVYGEGDMPVVKLQR